MKFFTLLAICCSFVTILFTEESFDSKVEKFMKSLNLPGLAVATVTINDQGNASTQVKTYGYAELETFRSVDQNTGFWLGSVSKTFVGFAIVKAIDQGLISLDDDVNEFAVQYLTKRQVQAIPQYNLATWPDGGIRSSIKDLSNYLSKIMIEYLNYSCEQANSVSLLSRDSLNIMLKPQYTLSENEQIGIFWQTQKVNLNGIDRELIGHDGSDPGAFTFLLFDPKEKTGIIILANGQEGDDPNLLLNFIAELFDLAKKGIQ